MLNQYRLQALKRTCFMPSFRSFSTKLQSPPTRPTPTPTPTAQLRPPTDKDVEILLSKMNNRKESILTDPSKLEEFNTDWTKQYQGNSQILCRPNSAQEVASILQYCNEQRIPIVPQGGNTGLVGNSIPIHQEIILSLQNLNQIESFDCDNGILTCGSGCILQTLQDTVSHTWNHLVPIDLGAKGSCMIGGNVSTNAGGSYYYRFGSIHANILGLEVVLPNGSILDLMNANRKDNTGYDLKHLFVGAEGTLGVITKIVLSCPRLPQARNVAFLACDTFRGVQQTLALAKQELGETLAAFEFLDQQVLDIVSMEKCIPLVKRKSDGDGDGDDEDRSNYQFCVLVETLGSNNDHDQEKMGSFLEKAMENGGVVDGILAQDLKQVHEMWDIRESCNPTVKSHGYNYKYDLSLPISQYYDIVEETRKHLQSRPDVILANWGHVIDGNIHINVVTPGVFEEDPDVKALLEPYIFESVVKRGGSISAEHGLGQQKNKYLGTYAKDKQVVSMMRSLKQVFDPNGILNPGKYLPPDE